MNYDQVSGLVVEAIVMIKEVTGMVTGSDKLQTVGLVDQAAGLVQKTYGDVKEKTKDALKSDPDRT